MGRRRRPHRRARAAGAALLLVATGVFAAIGGNPAYADATKAPPFPANCPGPQYPPAGYFDPTPAQPTPPLTYTGPKYRGPIPYEVPFKGIIFDGSISLPPNVTVPHLFASVCGLVELPQLTGTISGKNVNFDQAGLPAGEAQPPNVYIAGLEALPATVMFNGDLVATIDLQPAHNGGLDITLHGSTTAQVTTLGMTCGITLNATFTTLTSGLLSGRPVTGPTKSGQAEVVSNTFPVPAVQASTTCPAAVAQTFNKLLGLPVGPGVGTFTAPFCFDFELEGPNTPQPTASCPWPH
jgi:hypothetical protein